MQYLNMKNRLPYTAFCDIDDETFLSNMCQRTAQDLYKVGTAAPDVQNHHTRILT